MISNVLFIFLQCCCMLLSTQASIILDTTNENNPQKCYTSDKSEYSSMIFLRGDGTHTGDVTLYYDIIDVGKEWTDIALAAEVVYNGIGWVYWAVSQDGRSEGVLGLPDDIVSPPLKYVWNGDSIDEGGGMKSMPEQTLVSSSIHQTEDTTTLSFIKLVREKDEIEIRLDGLNTFQWGVGASNVITESSYTEQSFQFDFSQSCNNLLPETIHECTEGSCITITDTYQNKIELDNDLTLHYSITHNQTTLSAQLIYKGLAWIGLAISPHGEMIGSGAVIGLPDQDNSPTNPGEYSLENKTLAGVALASSQNLVNASIIQNEDSTILTFSKFLTDMPIHWNGSNTFLWAVGSSNTLGYHKRRSTFQIHMSDGSSTAGVTKRLLKAHGILALIAWAVATPLAILASKFRNVFRKRKRWFVVHLYLNGLSLVVTITVFILAVIAVHESGETHFRNPHHIVGIIMLLILPFQIGLGILRPRDANDELNRKMWEIVHRSLGYILCTISIWQLQAGLKRYTNAYGTNHATLMFWWWLLVLACLWIFILIKSFLP